MAQVALHKIDIVTSEVTRTWIPINEDTTYDALTQTLPTSVSGNTQVTIKNRRDGGKSLRVLETPFQIDGINQLQKAISIQGTFTEASIEMYDGNVLALAHAAVGTVQTGGAITTQYFVNIATATVTTAIAVTLPIATANAIKVLKNPQTFAINVFPAASGYIQNGAINAAYSLAAGATVSFYTKNDGATSLRWFVIE